MQMFGGRKARRATPTSEPSDHLMVSRVASYTAADSDATPSAAVAAAIEQTPDYAQVGEHVGAVLEAATQAAKKMRQQAVEAARQTRGEAKQEARALLEEAQERAKQVEADAALLEVDVKEKCTKMREHAEAYAGTTREAADNKAAEVLDRAEQQAAERVRATQARLHMLDEHVAGTEQRLRELVGRLREHASSLDDLLSGSEAPDPAAGLTERGSLDGALTRHVAEHRLSASGG